MKTGALSGEPSPAESCFDSSSSAAAAALPPKGATSEWRPGFV